MTKGIKVLIVVLVILVGILAASSGFFFAKSMNLEKSQNANPTVSTSTKPVDASNVSATSPTNTTTTPTTSLVTQAAPIGNRPSSPTDSYTVTTGDTLSVIGGKLDISWLTLADANGLSTDDANKIKIGQVLVVPKNNQISYTVNASKVQELQTSADGGKNSFRLSAVDTAKSDAPTAYGLAVADTFTQKTLDTASGLAVVTATHNGKVYEIDLTQPVTKGEKGIWAISTIKLSK